MGKLIQFPGVTRLDLDPKKMLEFIVSKDLELDSLVLIGSKAGTGDLYFSASKADGADVLWLMEVAKRRLLDITELD